MVSFATAFGYVVYFVSVNTCGLIMFNMFLLMWVYSSVLGPSVEVNYHRFQFYPSPAHCLCFPSSLFFSVSLSVCSKVCAHPASVAKKNEEKKKLQSPLQVGRITRRVMLVVQQVAGPMGDLVALITFLLLAVEEKGIKWDCFLNQLSLAQWVTTLAFQMKKCIEA